MQTFLKTQKGARQPAVQRKYQSASRSDTESATRQPLVERNNQSAPRSDIDAEIFHDETHAL